MSRIISRYKKRDERLRCVLWSVLIVQLFPENTRRWPNVGLINPTLGQRLLVAEKNFLQLVLGVT